MVWANQSSSCSWQGLPLEGAKNRNPHRFSGQLPYTLYLRPTPSSIRLNLEAGTFSNGSKMHTR